ncbi:hypothetical protein Athai_65180 [Actinocatenispora thailandica]|uniref:MobA-like NTP transferase domain-containing protein n=1 Tax=Actinocatenispora thailandica TaxID=227318 RepID=A0A7R7DW87_9ACTN|nr:NTP transferase domain-containing protein [Actinocatenispora thailandica]BCJ39015.1 hypothetical protein Athai_65180 [Actinocatenispora thailandica]
MGSDLAAIVLAGGAARRWGGRHKPAVPVAGTPMLDRVLAAVAGAWPRVVVGPAQAVPDDVVMVRENPPLGGPAAAIAAGTTAVLAARRAPYDSRGPHGPAPGDEPPLVAVLAGDQPLLSPEAVAVLADAAQAAPAGVGGAVYVDGGRPQLLCGVWRLPALARRCVEAGGPEGEALAGSSVRALLSSLHPVLVSVAVDPPPWYDCDTPADAERAAAILRGATSRRSAPPLRADGES